MDLGRLLDPIEGPSPSGVELRYDPRFDAIDRLLDLADRTNKLTDDGRIDTGASNPDWQSVVDESMALAAEGRDLRLLVKLVRGLAQVEGFSGLTAGLEMLTVTVDRYWDSLHPELRDRPDPAIASLPRTNALKQLENDENGLLGDLKYNPAFVKRPPGPIYGMDLAASVMTDNEVLAQAPGGLNKDELDQLLVRHREIAGPVTGATRALAAEEAERAQELIAQLSGAEAATTALAAKFNEKAGFTNGAGLSLNELTSFIAKCRRAVEAAMTEMGPVAGALGETGASGVGAPLDAGFPGSPGAAPAGPAVAAPGTISSRADVEATLDRIVEFYDKTEPSSPIPYLIRRVRKMVPMDFAELMAEVAPGGVKDFNALAGLVEDGASARRRRGNDKED